MRVSVIRDIERKELNLFFAAPIGYLFIALFLAVTLFTCQGQRLLAEAGQELPRKTPIVGELAASPLSIENRRHRVELTAQRRVA